MKIIKLLILTGCIAFVSCKKNCKEDCKEACNLACKESIEHLCDYFEEIQVVNNISPNGKKYSPLDDMNDDVVFNIDMRRKDYQILHVEACSQRLFYITGMFKGKKPLLGKKFKLEKAKFAIRNIFNNNGKTFEIVDVKLNAKRSGNDSIIIDVKLNEIQGDPSDNTFDFIAIDKKINRNTKFDIHLYDANGDFEGCPQKDKANNEVENIGGHACNGIISY